MTSPFRWLARRSRPFIATAALGLVVLLALVDRVTGSQVRFFIFYWPAIALAAWFLGIAWGWGLVAAATAAWLVANAGSLAAEASITVVVWNAAVNATSFALLAWLIARLRTVLDRERQSARTDPLTGVANTRAFSEALRQVAARSQRDGVPLTLAYVDVDDFKTINDQFGHSAGDQALHELAQAIRRVLRVSDSVGRLGGDEFALLLPGTGAEAAATVLQRLRHELAVVAADHGWRLTVSVGAIVCRPGACSVDDLIHRADTLMYEVKNGGKNSVRIADFTATP